MEPTARHDVFISYSSADEAWAQAALGALEGLGLRCWIAPRDIVAGETWSGAIVAGIHGCRLMLLVFSRHSNESQQVTRELVQAAERGVHILPLRIDDVQPSNDKAYYLGAAHWRSVPGGPTEQNLAQLCKDVRQLLAMPPPAEATRAAETGGSRAPSRPLRWSVGGALVAAALAFVGWRVVSAGQHSPIKPNPGPIDPEPHKKDDHKLPQPAPEPAPHRDDDVHTFDPKPDARWKDAPESMRKGFEPAGAEWIETAGRSLPTRIRHRATGIEFVLVPAGKFELGAASNQLDTRDEQPVRQVRMSPYYIARFEVSKAQFGVVAEAGDAPVADVTQSQAQDWCTKNGLALPSEAQWEYAASGPQNRIYPWGDEWNSERCNGSGESDRFRGVAPIGSFASGASWCGAEDMAGNVAEWCRGAYRSGYGDHRGELDPEPPAQDDTCVARGGSWSDRKDLQRTSDRRPYQRSAHDPFVGFRCVFVP